MSIERASDRWRCLDDWMGSSAAWRSGDSTGDLGSRGDEGVTIPIAGVEEGGGSMDARSGRTGPFLLTGQGRVPPHLLRARETRGSHARSSDSRSQVGFPWQVGFPSQVGFPVASRIPGGKSDPSKE